MLQILFFFCCQASQNRHVRITCVSCVLHILDLLDEGAAAAALDDGHGGHGGAVGHPGQVARGGPVERDALASIGGIRH